MLLYSCTLDQSLFTRYQTNTAVFNWSPCIYLFITLLIDIFYIFIINLFSYMYYMSNFHIQLSTRNIYLGIGLYLSWLWRYLSQRGVGKIVFFFFALEIGTLSQNAIIIAQKTFICTPEHFYRASCIYNVIRNHMQIVFEEMSSWTLLTMYLGAKTFWTKYSKYVRTYIMRI